MPGSFIDSLGQLIASGLGQESQGPPTAQGVGPAPANVFAAGNLLGGPAPGSPDLFSGINLASAGPIIQALMQGMGNQPKMPSAPVPGINRGSVPALNLPSTNPVSLRGR